MKDIFQRIFTPLVLVVLLLFIGQVRKAYYPSYLPYQKQFKKMSVPKIAPATKPVPFKYGVRQRWIEALNRTDRCETCHLGIDNPGFEDATEPFKTHPDFMSHDFEKFGCTVCHGGQGSAVTFESAHGPVENWHDAIYHPNFMENSCAGCHGELSKTQMPVYTTGRFLFTEDGCLGCHKVKGQQRLQVGPPLENIGTWMKTDWLFRWIQSPQKYLSKTRMPDYKFSDLQSANIARFLLSNEKANDIGLSGSYDNGKNIFGESRCITCHAVYGKGGIIGPDLAKVSTKMVPERLEKIVNNPQKLWPQSKMPIFGFTDAESVDLATFMLQEYIDFDLTDEQIVRQTDLIRKADAATGKKLINENGCIGCHEKIDGVKNEGDIGPELTDVGITHISHFEFGGIDVAKKDRTVPNWIYNKMLNPRLYKKELNMPSFYFNTDTAAAVTTYLLSLKGDLRLPLEYKRPFEQPPIEYSPQGQFGVIVGQYRCLVCHKIYGNGGDMAPELTWEGSRAQKNWLINYMKMPDTIRPLLVERMPRFKISNAECEAIYNYCQTTLINNRVEKFTAEAAKMSLNQPDIILLGKNLYYNTYGCDACHTINLKGGSIAPDLTNSGKRLSTEWTVFYLHDPKVFVTQSVEPVYHFSDAEIEALTAFILSPKEEK